LVKVPILGEHLLKLGIFFGHLPYRTIGHGP